MSQRSAPTLIFCAQVDRLFSLRVERLAFINFTCHKELWDDTICFPFVGFGPGYSMIKEALRQLSRMCTVFTKGIHLIKDLIITKTNLIFKFTRTDLIIMRSGSRSCETRSF